MINWNRVNELRDEIGAEDFDEVVEIFLEEVEEIITLIREEVPQSDMESHLHFLKGSALNLGFREFTNLCQEGETAAEIGSYEKVDLSAVVACYERSKIEFLNVLAERTAA